MEQEKISKAFEGRWHMKQKNIPSDPKLYEDIKALCRDFFEAGVLLSQGFVTHELIGEDGKPSGMVVTARHDPLLDTSDNGFSEWWDLYDKKIDRGKCEKKWQKLTDEERRACIDSTPAYVASTPDLQFRRHPMTYLNNKSWENQIIPHNNGTVKSTKQDAAERLADILIG